MEQPMHCWTSEDVESRFGGLGFSISDEHRWYRRQLVLSPEIASNQERIAASPPDDPRRLTSFLLAVNHWLPTDRGRLLWVQHWEGPNGYDPRAVLHATRAGVGELRSVDEAPGHYFEAHSYGEWDQAEVGPAQRAAVGLLVGLLALMIVEQSDGWLIAEGCPDRFEVWEGNVLFHSADAAKVAEAGALLAQYNCQPMK